jgi:hypothetical protein
MLLVLTIAPEERVPDVVKFPLLPITNLLIVVPAGLNLNSPVEAMYVFELESPDSTTEPEPSVDVIEPLLVIAPEEIVPMLARLRLESITVVLFT